MNEALKLKRVVTGEFAPQYWTVSGKSFDEMLDAVKALPYRQWQGRENAWQVKGDGIIALQQSGLKVIRDADVRVELENDQQSLTFNDTSVDAEIVLNYRRASGEWAVNSQTEARFQKTITFTFTPEEIAPIEHEIEQEQRERGIISERNLTAYAHKGALLKLTMHAIRELDAKAAATYKSLRGKSTKDKVTSAIEAAWKQVQ